MDVASIDEKMCGNFDLGIMVRLGKELCSPVLLSYQDGVVSFFLLLFRFCIPPALEAFSQTLDLYQSQCQRMPGSH